MGALSLQNRLAQLEPYALTVLWSELCPPPAGTGVAP